jgi:hypothetical protein
VVRSATLHLQLKIKTFQECTIKKNKEVEIMEGWCLACEQVDGVSIESK